MRYHLDSLKGKITRSLYLADGQVWFRRGEGSYEPLVVVKPGTTVGQIRKALGGMTVPRFGQHAARARRYGVANRLQTAGLWIAAPAHNRFPGVVRREQKPTT